MSGWPVPGRCAGTAPPPGLERGRDKETGVPPGVKHQPEPPSRISGVKDQPELRQASGDAGVTSITRNTTFVSAPNWTEVEKIPAGRWAFAPPERPSCEGSARRVPEERVESESLRSSPLNPSSWVCDRVRRRRRRGRRRSDSPFSPPALMGSRRQGAAATRPPRHVHAGGHLMASAREITNRSSTRRLPWR
jgi:hypothetical protein